MEASPQLGTWRNSSHVQLDFESQDILSLAGFFGGGGQDFRSLRPPLMHLGRGGGVRVVHTSASPSLKASGSRGLAHCGGVPVSASKQCSFF